MTEQESVEVRAGQLLQELGIEVSLTNNLLLVNRTSMVNFSPKLDEQRAYDAVLLGLREEFPEYYVYWGGRTDEHFEIGFFGPRTFSSDALRKERF